MLNVKTCPNLNCIMNILIDKIFIYSSQQNDENNKLKKELFEIYFDYFSSKIYEIGNPPEESNPNYQNKIVSLSFIINILKQLFKFILHYSNDDISKSKITTLLINCVLLTKNSQFFGNYIYIIRCLFKYLSYIHNSSNGQYEFHREALHLVYGIMKYMITQMIMKFSPKLLMKEEKQIITELMLVEKAPKN